MIQKESIQTAFDNQLEEVKSEYASVKVARQLLMEALPFRGCDKSETSIRRDHFLNFLEWC